MKSSYDFQAQIAFMNDLFQTNITLAERTNTLLRNVPKNVLDKIVHDLKKQYEQKYEDDVETFTSIKNTLNLISREGITDVDKNFMDLALDINDYYKQDLVKVQKKLPYSRACQYCHTPVANDRLNLRWHEQKCKNTQDKNANIAPQRKTRKKEKDTQERYEERQIRGPQQQQADHVDPTVSSSLLKTTFSTQIQIKHQKLQTQKKTKAKKQKFLTKLQDIFYESDSGESILNEKSEPSYLEHQIPLEVIKVQKKKEDEVIFESESDLNYFGYCEKDK